MSGQRRMGRTRVALVALTVVAVLVLAGCGSDTGTVPPPKAGPTALAGLAVAQSALSTVAPDAKLLVAQTAQSVQPTSTPVWAFLFGSPGSDKTYIVYVTNGQAMGAQESVAAGLSKEQWAEVPGAEPWKVDSDQALMKALAAVEVKGVPAGYMMGLLTYKPSTDTSTIEPFVWSVIVDSGEKGSVPRTVKVDARTGEAVVAK